MRRLGSWLALAMTIVVGALHAQDISAPIEDEVRQRLRVNTEMSPLGKNPFGESVNLYNGTLSFEQTDIDLKGNGPDLKLTRSYAAEDTASPYWRAFVDWKMEVPHIETIVTPNESGFFINSTTGRCSAIASNGPAPISLPNNNGPPYQLDISAWWYGYHLDVPGEGSQDLILPGAQNTRPLPHMTLSNGQAFNAIMVTSANWAVGCLSSTSNGVPGEGFLAIAPDGTQYWLDWLIYKRANDYGQAPASITRNLAMMMVSHVVDRFGNTLVYNYDANGNLTTVTASDGRLLTLTYGSYTIYPSAELPNPDPGYRVATAQVTASNGTTRTWNYTYDPNPSNQGDLIGVTLPDGSAWAYSLDVFRPYEDSADLRMIDYVASTTPCTYTLEPQLALTSVGTITHPSGLVGTFTAKNTIRGESYVPYGCESSQSTYYLYWRNVMSYTALVQKSFSGAGLSAPETWNYSYSAPNQSWSTDACASNNSCVSTIYTDVVDPNGNDVRYTYSNRFDATENQLLDTTYYQGAAGSSIVRDVQTAYAPSNTGPWPASLGRSLGGELNTALVTSLVPLNRRQTLQSGDTYTWQALAFDAYAQATDVKRYNSIAGQSPIEETTTYLNDPTLWVLGLPQQVTNVTTGEIETLNTYSPSNDTLQSRASFGETLMSYTYNGAGQLASFTDGNSHATSLSSYYRGIPQLINYPDQTSESLVVDDFGEITGITDQNGHATQYSYDPMSRVAGITYPTGDEVAWYPETLTYSFISSAERGIGGGHWDRTITTGSAVTTTYFDAELRPLLSDTSIPGTDITTGSAYDWQGQTTFASYPIAGTPSLSAITTGTHKTYDALERPFQTLQDSELGMLTTTMLYPSSASTQVTDPNNNVTTTYYQVFDEPSYNAPIQVWTPAGVTQNIARDLYGNPTSITQSGLYGTENDSVTKTLAYDSYHRLCRTTEPESGSEVMAYDAANNLAWSAVGLVITGSGCGQEQVPAAAQTTRTYDAMNRLKTVLPPAGTQSTSYGYDPVGHMTSALSGITTWNGVYNFRGLLTGESMQLVGQNAWGIGYAHDAYGHVSLVQYPDGEDVNYSPDGLGRPAWALSQAGAYASIITYWPNGQTASIRFGNGSDYVSDQNTRQMLSDFSYGSDGTPSVSEDISYDADANIKTVQDLVTGQRSKTFQYDGLNRLTSALAPGLSINETYGYDALNNLRQRVINGLPFNFNIDAFNHLNSMTIGSSPYATYGYDPPGDRTSVTSGGATINYTFDAKQQLVAVPTMDSYAYDAFGRRVMKAPASGEPPVYSFYDQGGQLMYEIGGASQASTNFIYLGSKLIARNVGYNTPYQAVDLSVPASSATGSYTVSWSAISGVTTYVLQEQTNGGAWVTIQAGSATSIAISGKAAGVYAYKAQACNLGGCGPWGGAVTTTVTFPPAMPASITVPATSTGSVVVSWAASAGATSYNLQQSILHSPGDYHPDVYEGTGTSFTGTVTLGTGVLTQNGDYTYEVNACNAGGCSAFVVSSAIAVSVPPASAPTLTVPVYNGSGSYTVSWSAVKEALSYTLQQQTNGGAWVTMQNSSALSLAITGNAYATYGYQVQACDVGGCSAWSPVGMISVAPSPLVPSFTYIVNGLGVKFTDTSTDSAGTITTHHWVFGKNSSSTLANPSNFFPMAGSYTVSETVTDNVGNSQEYIATVTVR